MSYVEEPQFVDAWRSSSVLTTYQPWDSVNLTGAVQLDDYAVFSKVMNGGRIKYIGYEVGTVGTGQVSVGVFRNTEHASRTTPSKPNVFVAASSAAAPSGVGYQEVSLGGLVEVAAGDWLALSCSSTSTKFRSVAASPTTDSLVTGWAYTSTDVVHPLVADIDGSLLLAYNHGIVLIGIKDI